MCSVWYGVGVVKIFYVILYNVDVFFHIYRCKGTDLSV